MDETGLWSLFLATGLPEAYLAAQAAAEEAKLRWEEPARTAFRPERPGGAGV